MKVLHSCKPIKRKQHAAKVHLPKAIDCMNAFKFCLVLWLLPLFTYAQREADAMYFRGCIGDSACWCPPPTQGNIFWFNDDSLQQIIDPACLPLRRFFSGAAFSDKHTGELIFASNGWRLIYGQGDLLTHKLWFDDIPHPGDSSDTTTVNVTAGPLFLNDPGDSTRAYLFYGQLQSFLIQNISFRADVHFTYALLDIPTRTLISKNNVVFSDTSSMGDMQACRHANGRDWWIIKPHIYTDLYYIGLLDPGGIEMNLVQLPDVPHELRANTSSKFNIQGTKYIQFTGGPGGAPELVHEYDFDRCEGILSNLIVHDIGDSIADNDNLSAITISPDGSKFYFKRNTSFNIVEGLFQFDLTNDEISFISRYVSTPQMMPNGQKMLFGEAFFDENNAVQYRVSEIINPNAPFDELIINHFKYNTPNGMLTIAPSNFAYFRLGAETGTICDSLSVGVPTNLDYPNFKFKIYPNPVESALTIEHDVSGVCQIKITDMLGRVQWQGNTRDQKTVLTKEIEELIQGMYWLEIQDLKTGKRGGTKFIKR
jgi:hypothetical protein